MLKKWSPSYKLRRLSLMMLMVIATYSAKSQVTERRDVKLMGCHFDITVVESDVARANNFIDLAIAEISRIEKLISSWDSNSETSEINRNSGIKPVKVDLELFQLIQRSIAISQLTDGAFDISFASMDRIWKFDGSMKSMPSKEEIAASVKKVGYRNIELNSMDTTVFLRLEGMKIAFGAIGKGYAADKARRLLESKGVKSAIINASGDMITWGAQANGMPWKVAIVNPMNKEKIFGMVDISDQAIVTSGDYEKFVIFDGERYAHIINPKTGMPTKGIISATVIAQSAELADALATSVFVMGIESGLFFINQLPGVECLLVDEHGKMWKSEGLNLQEKNN